MIARDVMTPNPICIRADSDVFEAVDFFLKNGVSSAPVTNAAGKVLGQLPELGLMRAFVKRIVQDTPLKRVADFPEQFVHPEFVREKDDLPQVLRSLIHSPLHRVLVNDERERMIGIISPKDVLRALTGDRQHSGTMVKKLQDLEGQVKSLTQSLKTAAGVADQYNKFFESSAYMMHSADRTGKIIMANKVLHRNLGYNQGELIGKSIYDIYPVHLHKLVEMGLKQIMLSGKYELTYSSFISKSGHIFRVEVVSSSVMDGGGKIAASFTISRPVDGESMLRALHGVLEPK